MHIIDKNTGKRIVNPDKKVESSLKQTDPLKRNAEKDLESEEHSPMEPPEAYDGMAVEGVDYDQMHGLLKGFMDEHKKGELKISQFEKALIAYKENGYLLNDEINEGFSAFFQFFDEKIIDHNQREEKQLFPLLHKRLIESGEKGEGENPHTAVDMMEDDHIKFIQLAALAFNMLGLAPRLPDERSQVFVNDVAYDNGRELIEMLQLHIHREENILFPLAHKLISQEEFTKMMEN